MLGALGDFLPPQRREDSFEVTFELPVGLRDLIQSVGVPHVEVGPVTLDGRPADWSARVDDGAEVVAQSRYPLARPPAEARLLTDVHLGRVTGYLRLVGLDVRHDQDLDDPALVAAANAEKRILLTRDRRLLMTGALERGSFVRATEPLQRAVEIVDRFALRPLLRPFTRCTVCNGELAAARPDEVAGRVPPTVQARHAVFRACPGCGRVYWEGSHHARLSDVVGAILEPPPGGAADPMTDR